MHADITQENNLTHTKQPKHSEWTQWDEAKSGRQDLWAAQMSVQLQKATQCQCLLLFCTVSAIIVW